MRMRFFPLWHIIAAAGAVVTDMMRQFDPNARPDPNAASAVPKLTPKHVEVYAFAGCEDREIADRFLVEEEALRAEFGIVLRATRGYRAYRIRKAQTDAAIDGNVTTLIWLGRNDFGQSTNPKESDESGPLEP